MAQPLQPAQPSQTSLGALRVFLSSTSVDLESYRTRVASLVQSLGQFAVTMNGFPLQPHKDATTVSLDQLRASQVYILLLAWRYGYVPSGQDNGEQLSVTHQEYREARRLGLPCFVFLADERTKDELAPFPRTVRDQDQKLQDQLLAFRKEVQQQFVGYFSTQEELVDKVAAALYQYLLDVGRPGRIPRDLPPKVPGFVGREDELERLMSTLRQGQSVGLSALVAGLGGVGKSALASETLQRLSQDASAFPGGITFVRCDGRTELEGLAWVYDQLLAAWGVRLPPEALRGVSTQEGQVEAREQALRERLGHLPGPALALMDNVEGDFLLARALDHLHSLDITLLVTARQRSSLHGLRELPLDILDTDAAVTLFAERYMAKNGDWNAGRDEPAARTVVETLGRLALAVELAAARSALTQMSVAELAEEMWRRDVLALLQDPLRDNASVRYSFMRSVALLTPPQRVRFAALGLPDGADWPRPVVEALLGAVPSEDEAVFDPAATDLERFAALSLLNLVRLEVPGRTKGEVRVRLHPLLRMLAVEEWIQQPASVKQAGLRGLATGLQRWFNRDKLTALDTHVATRAAVEWGMDGPLIAGTVQHVLAERAILQAVQERGDPGLKISSVDFFDTLSWQLAAIDEVRRYLVEELAKAQWQDVPIEQRWVLIFSLGFVAHTRGEFEQASDYYEQALTIARALGDHHGEANLLTDLGDVALGARNLKQARRYLDEAWEVAQKNRDHTWESLIHTDRADLARLGHQWQVARQCLQQARDANRGRRSRHRGAEIRAVTARLQRDQFPGQPRRACKLFKRALVAFAAIGRIQGYEARDLMRELATLVAAQNSNPTADANDHEAGSVRTDGK